jgi:hypothetical protein
MDSIQTSLAEIAYNVKINGNAKGDGISDDTLFITSLISSVPDGAKLFFPAGTYIISNDIVVNKNIAIFGVRGKSIIKIKNGSRIKNILKFNSVANVNVEGITFDMNMQNTQVYQASDYVNGFYNAGIYCNAITDKIKIINCNFINLYNVSIRIYTSSCSIRIMDCYFTSPQQTQNLYASHIELQTITTNGNIIIENNIFDNVQPSNGQYGVTAILAEGVKSQTLIRKNKLNWCGRDNTGTHRVLPIDLYGNCNFFTISDNVIDNCLWGFCRLEGSQDITVERNKFYQNGTSILTDPAIWIDSNIVDAQNEKNIKIKDNEFYCFTTNKTIILIAIYHVDWSKPPTNIEINGNSVYGAFDNFVSLGANVDTVNIINNRNFQWDGSTPRYLLNMNRIVGAEPSTVNATESSTSTLGITVAKNKWYSPIGAIAIDLSTYTGSTEKIIIEDNNLIGVTGMGSGIKINNLSCLIKNNFMKSNPEAVWAIGNKKIYLFNNILENMDNPAGFYLANATDVVKSGNYHNGTLLT